MIKKISAILLALVLCLSVVVVPASAYAYELASGSEVAYIVELDKDYYAAGETVTVNIYLYGKEGLEFGTGALVIGMNSDVFDMEEDENVVETIKETGVSGDAMASWYKDVPNASWAWQTNATILANIKANNTDEENEMFNQYLKITLAKNTSGSHANIGSNKNGIPTEDINADSEAGIPFISIKLKVRDDVADGTAINVGIPTGPMAKNYTYMNYYKNPGSATTVVKTTPATSEVVFSTTATVGEETAELIPLEVSHWKEQIRFDLVGGSGANANNYKGTFDYRMLATIDNFDEVIGTDYDKVLDVGFIFNKGADIDLAAAKAQVEGGGDAIYSQVRNVYVSTAYQGKTYVISCLVNNIKDADVSTALSAMAYVVYTDANGETAYAYSDVKTKTFDVLYNTYYSQAFPA